MGIFGPFFSLVCVILCHLDQGHSIPSHITPESSLFRSSEASSPITENFSECGKSKKNVSLHKLSIIGGNKSELGDWPWMVALFKQPLGSEKDYLCGGSLISRQWIITSAHCILKKNLQGIVERRRESDIYARLGNLHMNNPEDDSVSPFNAPIDKIVTHPKYSPDHPADDIAIMRLRDSIPFTANIRPICLLSGPKYTTNEYYNGKEAFIAGWGRVNSDNNELSKMLLAASVPVVEQNECAQKYVNVSDVLINEKVICAGKHTCNGDSGGPLMFLNETEERFYLGGVVSGSSNSCDKNHYPTRFTKVAPYINWINEVADKDF